MIEDEIFKKGKINYSKLNKYGFIKENNIYTYKKKINEEFETIITVDKEKITGKIYDLDINEEYTNFRIKNNIGSYANDIKEKYENILKDIKNNCFDETYFALDQTNRITEYIIKKYKDKPEFPWKKFKGYCIFRNKNNDKWYAIIMNIDKSKLEKKSGETEILNIKLDEKEIKKLIKKEGFYEAYHMNKKNWITITLDDTINDEQIIKLIDNSYDMINAKESWIIPANPKYFDVINYLDNNDVVEWPQKANIHIGDTVYLYIAAPFSAILYKCEVVEINIPYDYKNKNMKIKQVKKYKEKDLPFSKLNKLGIKAVRCPRRISKEIIKYFD